MRWSIDLRHAVEERVQLQSRQQSLASNLRVLRVQVRFLWNSHVARDLARTQMLDAEAVLACSQVSFVILPTQAPVVSTTAKCVKFVLTGIRVFPYDPSDLDVCGVVGFPSGELGPAVISRIDGKAGDYCEKYLSSQRSAAL